jgi:dTDP-4-dehydrorhamnose reductase
MVMRVLITGANGQLGQALQEVMPAFDHQALAFSKSSFNIIKPEHINAKLSTYRPDVVINAAAATRVDELEENLGLAFTVNAIAARDLAVACRKNRIKLVYISTDYVFDGEKDKPYIEWDKPNPLSVYGMSKLLGEKMVRQQCPDHFIVRTAWLYGKGHNFVSSILSAAKTYRDKSLYVINDQFGSPTSALALARQILSLIKTNFFGTYHATCQGSTSWYDFAKLIIETAGINVKVEPCSTLDYIESNREKSTFAKRPLNSVLENKLLQLAGLDKMPHWQDAFTDYWAHLTDKVKRDLSL